MLKMSFALARTRLALRAPLLGLGLFAACAEDAEVVTPDKVVIAFSNAPSKAPGKAVLEDVLLRVVFEGGAPAKNLTVELAASGGGAVTPTRVTTNSDGEALVDWTLGALPLDNRLVASAGVLGTGETLVRIDPAAPLQTARFAEIHAYLAGKQVTGSTEDLAFSPDGVLVAGHPGGLITVSPDGAIAAVATSGEALVRPLGLAYDQRGELFVADSEAKALMGVSEAGVVRKVQDRDGVELFLNPNDVTVAADGTVYLSDTCTGKVYAIDPATGQVTGRIAFDPSTEGGPNGVAIGPDGALWMTTENTALFCGHDSVELTAAVAGLFRIPLVDGAFGPKEAVATGVGVFGDGLAFDNEGNLFVIFDTVKDFALDESIVFLRPSTGGPLARAFAAKGKVYANLAFGGGAYGPTTMYLTLLAMPPFTPDSERGLERVRVEVGGAPIPPLADAL